ncbi:putative bifunctional diguanylate cyclase/phosphodiesterase [Simiduia aestuariiviva]|uniref:Diguanylate cyclase (GGDEF)-like protein n=1 Tax=Simiduia aestuariiviva TaxID=1510459 RepID=A0A839UU59_9GAMM|nr:EAL domain-containing protein [Simiduia aestuariiviva]MBB3169980.1 diguanylate cyclase (GGDEF)-like protein [Simiduia aestuariiviva]
MTSFRARLLLVFIALLSLTLVAITWAVFSATQNAGHVFANNELDVAERVFKRLIIEDRGQLKTRVSLLSEDYGFRQAVAIGEEETLITALANHGERVGAEMVLLTDGEGRVKLSSHDLTLVQPFIAVRIAEGTSFDLLVQAEQQLFQFAMVPVRAPSLIGWVGLGFPLKPALLENFKSITRVDVTMMLAERAIPALSTLPAAAGQNKPIAQSNVHSSDLIQRDWLTRTLAFEGENAGDIVALLTVPSSDIKAQFNQLQQRLILIAALALVLVVAAIFRIANGLSQPLATLAAAADRMAAGDYDRPVQLTSTDELGLLANSLNRMQAAIKEREAHITFMAEHDERTGLPNREKVQHILADLFAEQTSFTAVLLRVSNIKRLNDLYGILFVQRFMPLVAERLKSEVTACGTLARLGSDEFLLILTAGAVINRQEIEILSHSFSHPFSLDGVQIVFEMRAGVVDCPAQASNYEFLIRRSNIALTEAVRAGQKFYYYQDGADDAHLRKLQITARLQHAIEHGNFELFYQPQLSLLTGEIEGMEALIRWKDETLGSVFPDEFIPLAEESGLISDVTRWVVGRVREDCMALASTGKPIEISINLSAKDILDTEMLAMLTEAAVKDLPAGCSLAYEITETALVADAHAARENLLLLKNAGIHLSMDDFGTGFSSLSQLKMLPVSKLKIDKSFVMKLASDCDDQNIVEAILGLAKALKLSVVAEGVEDATAMSMLDNWGCQSIQGYHLARPMPVTEALVWLENYRQKEGEMDRDVSNG